MAKGFGFGLKVSDHFELPAETIGGVPKLTITGMNRVLIEQHKGLLKYTNELIEINGGRVNVKIRGEKLMLKAMTRQDMLISGRIFSAEFE